MPTENEVLTLKLEGLKSITAQASGERVALIVWRKNGAPLLPLVLSRMEAQRLCHMLTAAVNAAKP